MKALIENADNMKLTSIYYRKKTKESYLSLNCDFHLNSNSTNNKKKLLNCILMNKFHFKFCIFIYPSICFF